MSGGRGMFEKVEEKVPDVIEIHPVPGDPAYYRKGEENGCLFLVNIYGNENKNGMGYIVFHHFLIEVGKGNIFITTSPTVDGDVMFGRAISDGLISREEGNPEISNSHIWRCIGDPAQSLGILQSSEGFY